ncbi:murein biosynthesis integral membrane protein MurJ [Planococcus sp. X10-3]|uniref:murein biosynthesis integral membrane protein MurJ n=1 Tax=Planococcus sp. X10-3 TaxID=3061240 RepID=UPI003BAE8B57
MKKTILLVMVITVLSKFLGLGRDLTLAYFYGTSFVSDAYLIAIVIPSVFLGLLGKAVNASYIPVYTSVLYKEGLLGAEKFTNKVVNLIALLGIFMTCVVLIFTEYIVMVFASGFEGEVLAFTINLVQISALSVFFALTVFMLNGYLELKGNFTIPSLIGVPLNIALIAFIVLSKNFSVYLLGVGILLAYFTQFLLVFYYAYKLGYRFQFNFNFNDKNIRYMLYIAFPVVIGKSANQINKIVDKTIASNLGEGSISALQFASTINLVVISIFVLAVTSVLFPKTSKLAAEGDYTTFKEIVRNSLLSVIIFVLPIAGIYIFFSENIISILYGRGEFGVEAIALTSEVLIFYSIGMVAIGAREVLSNAFYSLKDTKTPLINSSIAICVNIVLNIILSKFMGINGLALATSISALLAAILLFFSLSKKIGDLGIRYIFILSTKIFIATSLMIFITINLAAGSSAFLNEDISFLIALFIGAIVYSGLLYLLRVKEARLILNLLHSKFVKK